MDRRTEPALARTTPESNARVVCSPSIVAPLKEGPFLYSHLLVIDSATAASVQPKNACALVSAPVCGHVPSPRSTSATLNEPRSDTVYTRTTAVPHRSVPTQCNRFSGFTSCLWRAHFRFAGSSFWPSVPPSVSDEVGFPVADPASLPLPIPRRSMLYPPRDPLVS